MKKLAEIRELLKKYNENWWKNERPDLDLKYYIPTDAICEGIADYEVDIPDEFEKDDMKYLEFVQNHFKEINDFNTSNWSARVQNDIQGYTFKMNDGRYLLVLAFHIGGDIRGNYTDFIALKFDYDLEFDDIIRDICDNDLGFDFQVGDRLFEVHPTFSEYLEVYDSKTENINDCICAYSDEELKEKLEKMIEEEELYAKI